MAPLFGPRRAESESMTEDTIRRIEELGREECLSLLGRHTVGRLAVLVNGRPDIVPVNYALGLEAIVLHARLGGLLDRASRHAAAFEIDGVDGQQRAWSVTVRGILEDISEAADGRSVKLQVAPAAPAAPGDRPVVLAISIEDVTGRRFALPPFATTDG